MTVYLDILFFINFFMNYLVISLCAAIAAKKVKIGRKLLGSCLGGIYGIFIFIPDLSVICSFLSAFLFSGVMVWVVFYPFGIKDFLKSLSAFYISSFVLSGGIYMILPYIGGGVIRNSVLYYGSNEVILPATGIFFVALKTMAYIRKQRTKKGYRVSIKYRENKAFFDAFLDTGNMLYDPVSKKPVVVADKMVLEKLFSKNCNLLNIWEWVDSTDIRLIPYKTLDNEGVMLGFLTDEFMVDEKVLENVIVALSPKTIKEGILINDGVF